MSAEDRPPFDTSANHSVPGPSPEAIREALERLLSDATFATSPQLSRFVRFVVNETLAGRGDTLKEYTVGIHALGRPTSFDPSTDSSVRAAARQIRLKLAAYAIGEGRDSAITISLPKGSYHPQFEWRHVAAVEPTLPTPRPDAWWKWPIAMLTVTVLVSTAIVVGVRIATPPRAEMPDQLASIAVLPFVNLTGDTLSELFTDALTDEITLSLARTTALRVVARTSAFAFKGKREDVREVGRKLGTSYVLEGSLRQIAGRWRIGVQLISATDGLERWSVVYDIERRDADDVYVTIAAAVVQEINRHSMSGAVFRTPPAADTGARRLYREARYLWSKRTPESLRRSVELFEAALTRDSTFALAAAGLADAYATMAVNNVTAPGESPPRAIAAAQRAITLDPALGEPHATLGLMRAFHQWDWTGADTEFATAIALSPNYSTAYSWYAITLQARGRFDDALTQLTIAQQLDPLSVAIAYNRAELLYNARRWSDALAALERVFQLEPNFQPALVLQGRIFVAQHNLAAARNAFIRAGDSLSLAQEIDTAPDFAPLRQQLNKLGTDAVNGMPYWMAVLHARMGHVDSSFIWLERAIALHHINIVALRVEPGLDPIRHDQRYQKMLRRLRLD